MTRHHIDTIRPCLTNTSRQRKNYNKYQLHSRDQQKTTKTKRNLLWSNLLQNISRTTIQDTVLIILTHLKEEILG